MGISTTTMAVIGAVAAVASATAGVVSSVQSAEAQRQQQEHEDDMAQYNAQVAEINAQRAEDEGKEAKKEAYEEATRKRQETAQIVGQQRAAQAASGAQVDQGANLDLNLDTAEKGELDAFSINKQGQWEDYNKRVDAWNYRQQGAEILADNQFKSQQADLKNNHLQTQTVLKGISTAGSTIGKLA